MGKRSTFFILCAVLNCVSPWNNLNCPAPRAPGNGLSFIFRNGVLIHFRCHPGYRMRGKAVAHCINNMWTHPPPQCIPIRNYDVHTNQTFDKEMYHIKSRTSQRDSFKKEKQRELFNWDNKNGVYGDGPRRLPLINGIWPSQEHAEQVLALGPQSTPGPSTMVKEEIDIAELRHKQLEELKSQRYKNPEFRGKKKRGHKKRNRQKNLVRLNKSEPRETILALGSTEDGPSLAIVKSRKRHRQLQNKTKSYTPNEFITSRKSRVDTGSISPYHSKYLFNKGVTELRRRPVQELTFNDLKTLSHYDATCVERAYGRTVPNMAPAIKHAFVYRYETKKDHGYPYMVAKYRCLSGYHFTDPTTQTLFCKQEKWVGERPECVED